jgi:very-short-patch-repair endonuclease
MGLKRNVDYIAEHPFDGLVYLKQLHVDRFIIKVTLVTELDGEQHFVAVKSRGGDAHLKISQERDLCKDRYCVRNKINFLRIPYNIVPSYELLSRIIILINSGYQVYASYDHYFQRIRDEVDMTGIYYIDMLVKF